MWGSNVTEVMSLEYRTLGSIRMINKSHACALQSHLTLFYLFIRNFSLKTITTSSWGLIDPLDLSVNFCYFFLQL